MRIIAAAAIVAICVILQIADSNAYLSQRKILARKQINLLNLTTRILAVQERIASLTDIEDIPSEFYSNITTSFNNAKKAIEDKVRAARAGGKLAEICSTTALTSLEVLNNSVIAEFVRTAGNITNSLLEFLHQTDVTVEFARSIGVDLFAIPTRCGNADKEEATACTARQLESLSGKIEQYIAGADNILRIAESADGLVGLVESLANLRTVLKETSQVADTGIKAVETTATTCIAALQIVQISPPRLGLGGLL